MVDFSVIEQKWQLAWEKAKIGQAEVDKKRKKFFMIFAYPGISGYLHLGHMRGYTYTDVICRYKRMQGYNVLFPVGTHASGNQAIAFANSIKNKNKERITYLKQNGYNEDLKNIEDPIKLIEYFNRVYLDTWKKFGFIFDYRRFTCTLYEDYSKFIEWQFKKLNKSNLLVKKPYYATFCPRDGPVAVDPSETDISKGGNAEKVEYTLLKFEYQKSLLMAATLRPETIFGQTNIWVNPDAEYVKIMVGKESWIVSKEAFEKLKFQRTDAEFLEEIDIKNLIGKTCRSLAINKDLLILPAKFCNPKIGTGIVTSVPSDAPYDYIGLLELQKNKEWSRKYHYNYEAVKNIAIIPIIKIKQYGELTAIEISKKLKINSIDDIDKLEHATKEVYRLGYHIGIMNENCGKYVGMKVNEAKELVKKDLMQLGKIDVMQDLSEEVICRCGLNIIIKKIDDQWFIKYSDKSLKDKTKKHTKKMLILPSEYHNNINTIIDWFDDRACARLGNWLGTKLPFDTKWTIEPISDSTLYPIYYLISKYINEGKLKPEDLTEGFFDHVFLGKGKTKVSKKILNEIRDDFEYWYPLDINLGGKEHQTVHFPVFLMNHVAILDDKYWPKGIFVNWWLTGSGDKISKSKGGAEPLTQSILKYSVDALSLYYCHIGSPNIDIIWNSEVAFKYKDTLERIYNTISALMNITSANKKPIDEWLLSELNSKLEKINTSLENFDLRNSADLIYFALHNDIRWYLRRNGINKDVIREFLDVWVKLMGLITPHLAEEINFIYGGKSLLAVSKWPILDKKKIMHTNEYYIKQILDDINYIINYRKITPKKITLIIAENWKYNLFNNIKKEFGKHRNVNEIIKKVMDKDHKKEVSDIVIKVMKDKNMLNFIESQEKEFELINQNKEFYEKEFKSSVLIVKADKINLDKKKQAYPGKVAIIIE